MADPGTPDQPDDDRDCGWYQAEVRAIREGFELGPCPICRGPLDRHTIAPDADGHAHAFCRTETAL
jgi:hypothetical protein